VRLVLVPALMAMFEQWNWWLPGWLVPILPSVDFEKPLPTVDLGDVVIIPDDISALIAPSADMRVVVKSAARLKYLVPDAISVADPLALRGCARGEVATSRLPVAAGSVPAGNGHSMAKKLVSGWSYRTVTARAQPRAVRPVHPVTMWRGRLSVALDALAQANKTRHAKGARPAFARCSPLETTTVQLPTGDRLQIPTGAETLRLKAYLIISRNRRRDYAEFAELVDVLEPETAAVALGGIDKYYAGQPAGPQPIAAQLVCRLADPLPGDFDDADGSPEASTDWKDVRQRCLSVAVAMLEEAR
jgi:RND superfamily putative drug exporter